jgi:hypothetical protein
MFQEKPEGPEDSAARDEDLPRDGQGDADEGALDGDGDFLVGAGIFEDDGLKFILTQELLGGEIVTVADIRHLFHFLD